MPLKKCAKFNNRLKRNIHAFITIEHEQRHYNNLLFCLFVLSSTVFSLAFFAIALIMTGQMLSCQTKAAAQFYSAKKNKRFIDRHRKKDSGLTDLLKASWFSSKDAGREPLATVFFMHFSNIAKFICNKSL